METQTKWCVEGAGEHAIIKADCPRCNATWRFFLGNDPTKSLEQRCSLTIAQEFTHHRCGGIRERIPVDVRHRYWEAVFGITREE